MRAVLVGLGLLVAAATPAAAEPMSADQIKTYMIGKPLSWKSKDGKFSGVSTYAPDGSAKVTANFKAAKSDTGTWQIKDGQFCTTWKVLREGQEKCGTWTRLTDTSFVDEGGTVAKVVK
jgi:hypothetical protein